MFDAQEHAVQIDRLLSLPVGQGHLDDAAADTNARIVDEDVHTAEIGLRVGDDALPGGFIGDVVR